MVRGGILREEQDSDTDGHQRKSRQAAQGRGDPDVSYLTRVSYQHSPALRQPRRHHPNRAGGTRGEPGGKRSWQGNAQTGARAEPEVGLQGMQERARQLGGSLEIRSGSDGTSVIAVLPLA